MPPFTKAILVMAYILVMAVKHPPPFFAYLI